LDYIMSVCLYWNDITISKFWLLILNGNRRKRILSKSECIPLNRMEYFWVSRYFNSILYKKLEIRCNFNYGTTFCCIFHRFYFYLRITFILTI
jgi:hypothetical protein